MIRFPRLLPFAAALAVLALPGDARPARSQTSVTYGGRAFCAQVHTVFPTPGTQVFADTGELAAAGGSFSDTLTSVSSAMITSGPAGCRTMGSGSSTFSQATMLDVSALAGLAGALSASEVTARATATCGSASGSATISGLVVAGVAVNVTGAANQIVSLPGVGTLVVNEQTFNGSSELTVNALHLSLLTGDELILCSTRVAVTCVVPAHRRTWGALKRHAG